MSDQNIKLLLLRYLVGAEGNEILRQVLRQGMRYRGWGMRQGEPYRSPEHQAQEAETGEYGPQTGPWPAGQQR